MAFLDFLFSNESNQYQNQIHQKIDTLFPEENEKDKIIIACVAGLMARVAYADMEVDLREKDKMLQVLSQHSSFEKKQLEAIVELALENIKELAGLENHRYCSVINENWDNPKRYQLLTSLFAIAAADQHVDHIESEELRTICTGLLLEHKHYIGARAKVMEYLDVLKS